MRLAAVKRIYSCTVCIALLLWASTCCLIIKNIDTFRVLDASKTINISFTTQDYTNNWLEWNMTLGGEGYDFAGSVWETVDGGFIIAGSLKGVSWLIKINAFGDIEWNKTYLPGWARSVQQTSDGGFITAGIAKNYNDPLNYDALLVKTDAHGNLEWSIIYGGSRADYIFSVQQTVDGGYIMAGYTYSFGAGYADVWLVKTDAYGNIMWDRTYGGVDLDEAYCVRQTSDGGYIVAGRTYSFDLTNMGDMWIIKTDAYGDVEWSRITGWPDWDMAYWVEQTRDGGYIVAGWRFSSYITRHDYWLIKLDANGDMEWHQVYNSGYEVEDEAYCVQQTSDGGYIIAGEAGNCAWIVKTDALGNMIWDLKVGRYAEAECIRQTTDGGYIFVGSCASEGGIDAWVVKFPEPSHDLAILEIKPHKTVVGQGYTTQINVTVENKGFFGVRMNITVYANNTPFETRTLFIKSWTSATQTFTWNTSNFPKGIYTISAYAEPFGNETNPDDNWLINGSLIVTIPGDVDADFDVDIYDIVKVCVTYGLKRGDQHYIPERDINDDGLIDIYDVVIACTNYGQKL